MTDPATARIAHAEAEFFRTLNAFLEPVVRAGCGAPGLLPTGMIVLETTGRRSGRSRRVPLMATVLDGCVFVSTLRGARSQWVRNLRAHGEVRYWLAGKERRGRARLFAPGAPPPSSGGLPPLARVLTESLLPPATLFGWTFAVIGPE
jgi:deazaflavin-dependent oxidoreductase (nitroreductase family)